MKIQTFNLSNYIANPDTESDDENIWKNGISIFYDQIGNYSEEYNFKSLRVGIGTDEAFKKSGEKTFSLQGENVIIKYGNFIMNNTIIRSQIIDPVRGNDFFCKGKVAEDLR